MMNSTTTTTPHGASKSSRLKIAFFDTKEYDRTFFNAANTSGEMEIRFLESRLDADSVMLASGCDAVCAFVNDTLNGEVIRELNRMNIRLIGMRCAGYNNVDLDMAQQCDIPVLRVPEYSPHAVAEYTIGMLLTLNRGLHRAYFRVRDHNFSINGLLGFDLYGKNIGIVGTGRIGRTLAELLQGFGVHLLGYDLYPDKKAAERLNMRYVTLDELYAQSDVISLHCPLTPENRHMVNRAAIQKMRDNVILLNTSRGQLIDTAALIDGLKRRKILAAGLDVYEEETNYFFEDCSQQTMEDDILARLLTFPNVLVTSHQAFFTQEAMRNIAETTLQNIRSFFFFGAAPNAVFRVMERNVHDNPKK